MTSNPKKIRNYYRLTLQISILVILAYMLIRPFLDRSYLADFEASCPFGGVQSLLGFLKNGNLACSMTTTQIALGIGLLVGVILFAKLFCSYICPVGTLTEWIGFQGRKLKLNFILTGWSDRLLRLLKYALLFITIYFTLTSSELFCKKFDPYYATLTGFSSDVNLWYALIALFFTIVGSFFVRQFWCKYLCPLGALTNIAVYALPAVSLILLWTLLTRVGGVHISWVWIAGIICFSGFILEAATLRFLIFPPVRIKRDSIICTKCRICDKQCPMAIKVSAVDTVQHIDCHMCTDCAVKCPEKGALTLNRHYPLWMPFAITVLLIAISFLVSNNFEIPTISEFWGNKQAREKAATFEMSGLKNIKCFGSSSSFANQMHEVKGILGVETFVKQHRVKVYYDSSVIKVISVKEAIFSPFSLLLNDMNSKTPAVKTLSVGIDHCFDPNDQYFLSELLKQEKGILAMQTHFGEPIKSIIYYDPALLTPEMIILRIEQPKVTIGETTEKIDFKVSRKSIENSVVSVHSFYETFLGKQDVSFNKYNSYKGDQLAECSFPFSQAKDPALQEWMPYLISHLSNDSGVVRFRVEFTVEGSIARISYVKAKTTPDSILKLLKEPMLLVYYPDGKTEKVKNPFSF
jgi:polyferredoxin